MSLNIRTITSSQQKTVSGIRTYTFDTIVGAISANEQILCGDICIPTTTIPMAWYRFYVSNGNVHGQFAITDGYVNVSFKIEARVVLVNNQ